MELIKQYPWIMSLPSMITLSLLGMFCNFLNKKVKGETLTDVRRYFHDNLKSTFTSLVATIISTVILVATVGTGQIIDLIAVVQLGYTCDNIFNNWEKGKLQ
jgi:hypothetical protein